MQGISERRLPENVSDLPATVRLRRLLARGLDAWKGSSMSPRKSLQISLVQTIHLFGS